MEHRVLVVAADTVGSRDTAATVATADSLVLVVPAVHQEPVVAVVTVVTVDLLDPATQLMPQMTLPQQHCILLWWVLLAATKQPRSLPLN